MTTKGTPDERPVAVTRLAHVRLVSRPAYRLITLRDTDSDAGVGAEDAIRQSMADVFAAGDYEVFVQCAQDLVPVAVDVEVWSGEPVPAGGPWSAVLVSTVEFPSGTFVVGSPTGAVADGKLPEGPGYYAVDVAHRGRAVAEAVRRAIFAEDDFVEGVRRAGEEHAEGVEAYLIRLWRTGDLPEDEDWD